MQTSRKWKPSLGAVNEAGGTSFAVWAPTADSLEVVISGAAAIPMQQDRDGVWSGFSAAVSAGMLYRYRLNGRTEFPDPASRFQPEGVHGPSQVISPESFQWTDRSWEGADPANLVIYELHIGTFSPEGTFEGARKRLRYLADLGITALEMMPIADFPGRWNWGYDGAALFAPARCYGTPDELRLLVDDAHRYGLAVLLDVVYNHFGPDGAYAVCYSPFYFTDRHRTPWGNALNFDGSQSNGVRRHFIENALHWLQEYHIDGLRLDATHSMIDESPVHFVAELAAEVRTSGLERPALLIAEDHRNIAGIVQPAIQNGWALDGVWSDDFHHEIRRCLTGESDGYFQDYRGNVNDLAEILRSGWLFCGRYSQYFREIRGTDPSGIAPERFVFFLQNHDQTGNRSKGERLHHSIDPASFRAATALLLLAPQTPLLFMGQEWAASTPFQYFTDHEEALGKQVREGRFREFARFAAFGNPETAGIPDPQAESTLAGSRLDWQEPDREPHASQLRLHRALLRLRKTEPALQHGPNATHDAQGAGDDAVILQRANQGSEIRIIVQLRSGGLVTVPRGATVVMTTEDAEFTQDPSPPEIDSGEGFVRFQRPGAVVLRIHHHA